MAYFNPEFERDIKIEYITSNIFYNLQYIIYVKYGIFPLFLSYLTLYVYNMSYLTMNMVILNKRYLSTWYIYIYIQR